MGPAQGLQSPVPRFADPRRSLTAAAGPMSMAGSQSSVLGASLVLCGLVMVVVWHTPLPATQAHAAPTTATATAAWPTVPGLGPQHLVQITTLDHLTPPRFFCRKDTTRPVSGAT